MSEKMFMAGDSVQKGSNIKVPPPRTAEVPTSTGQSPQAVSLPSVVQDGQVTR